MPRPIINHQLELTFKRLLNYRIMHPSSSRCGHNLRVLEHLQICPSFVNDNLVGVTRFVLHGSLAIFPDDDSLLPGGILCLALATVYLLDGIRLDTE